MKQALAAQHYQQLLAVLSGGTLSDADGHTAIELGKLLDLQSTQAKQWIRTAVDDGLLEYVGKRRLVRIDGERGYAPVYRIVKPPAKTKRRKA
jgi:hypothetical protein